MNNPFEYTPSQECEEAYRLLLERIDVLKGSRLEADMRFCRELEAGKMLGVLIAEDDDGCRHRLYAFSGQLGDGGFGYDGFVGAVYDYLDPEGYFKQHEREISKQNEEIARFERKIAAGVEADYIREKWKGESEMEAYREICRRGKQERAKRREEGCEDAVELAAMVRRSQYEKAELHRLKRRVATVLEPYAEALRVAKERLAGMKERRRRDSEELQGWLFDNFKVLNAQGERRSLREIFASTAIGIPPSGAGECCAPKLLQAAYQRGLRPLSMAEYWYGLPKQGEVRLHGEHYPACRGKCRPILGWMLQGVDVEPPLDEERRGEREDYTVKVIYENEWFCVIDKPSGMLSVPGKGRMLSAEDWLRERYGESRNIKMAHRLDQDTSGLLIAAFGEEALKQLQSLFARRLVRKRYVALLDGDYRAEGKAGCGRIELPLSADWLDRPRQKVDREKGKEAVTEYEFTGVERGKSRISLYPHTGRTHQLRVHSASMEGLGMPIAGDRLYGRRGGEGEQRLHLHAEMIEFHFPLDGKNYCFESPVPF